MVVVGKDAAYRITNLSHGCWCSWLLPLLADDHRRLPAVGKRKDLSSLIEDMGWETVYIYMLSLSSLSFCYMREKNETNMYIEYLSCENTGSATVCEETVK